MIELNEDRIIVIPDEAKKVTESGIIIPDMAVEMPLTGVIDNVGMGIPGDPMRFKKGDVVYYPRGAGVPYNFGDGPVLVLRQSDIIARK